MEQLLEHVPAQLDFMAVQITASLAKIHYVLIEVPTTSETAV